MLGGVRDKMGKAILGRKIGMTQVFNETGQALPVTVIQAGPCVVVQKRSTDTDGYCAVQVGFGSVKGNRLNKPGKGHFDKAKVKPKRYLRELPVDAEGLKDVKLGQEIKADIFQEGDLVDITGISKGKGFAGGVKRWGFRRGPMSHGSKYHRGPGSLQSRDASRVFKGRKLPGRMGGKRVTIQALEVIRVDPERDLLLVKGAVPGSRGSLVTVKHSVKAKK